MRTKLAIFSVLSAGIIAGGYLHCMATVPPVAPEDRPGTWAQKIAVKIVPNFHQVSERLFRGAQPPAQGFRELQRRGIKTVINLRESHTDDDEIGGLPLKAVHIPVSTWDLGDAQVVAFLRAATKSENQPVFVHCRHGSDRTGTMCAIYRIVVQGWNREEAIREMMAGDMGFHAVFENLPEYIRGADLDRIRREAGLK
jgi:protein tyrosine/serine phosphatase